METQRMLFEQHPTLHEIGAHTAFLAESTDAAAAGMAAVDGESGPTDWPSGNLKVLATIGEMDKYTGTVLTGVPDGQGAYLIDDHTVRLVYQSESYGPLSSFGRNQETWPFPVNNGIATFTGSHVQYIDYDRQLLSEFMTHDGPAKDMVKGAGELIKYVYNLDGDLVGPRILGKDENDESYFYGLRPHYSHTDTTGKYVVPVPYKADWFFQSLCASSMNPAFQWGEKHGFSDNIYLTNEEWHRYGDAHDFIGIPGWAVDADNKAAYPIAPIGMGGFEKLTEMSCGIEGYVCIVVSGYNGAFSVSDKDAWAAKRNAEAGKRSDGTDYAYPQNIVPSRVYVGKKGVDMNGNPADDFMSRNGLAYGKTYGFAVRDNELDRDTWHKDASKATFQATIQGKMMAVDYMWDGVVKSWIHDESIWGWQDAPAAGYKFWTALGRDEGGKKTEHGVADPTGATNFIQSSTAGYFGIYHLDGLVAMLESEGLGNGFDAEYENLQGEVPVKDQILLKGQGKTSEGGTQDVMCDSSTCHETFEDIDGFQWLVGSDGEYIMIQEDGGNRFGERTFIAKLDRSLPNLQYHFICQAGGASNTRTAGGVGIPAGTWRRATSSEFSGITDLTGLLKKGANGEYLVHANTPYKRVAAEMAFPMNEHLISFGLQQHSINAGIVYELHADRGGQIYMYQPNI